jgi:glycosyltransferase involved in cell wall biosynthesis
MFPRRFFTNKAAANLAISRHVMDRQRLPRTEVIYYGIQFPNAAPSDTFASQSSRQLTFAYVGRFVQEKGVPVLLQAAALLRKEGRHFSILLIGDGEQRSELEKFIQRENLGDTVRITGFLRGDQLAAEFDHVDVLVMPTLCEETAGLAAIEQMVRGRLVIASAIGGLGEIVEGLGLTFPAGDVVVLAGRMRDVIENPAQFQELALRSRAHSREFFRVLRMVEEHASVYRRVASAPLNSSGD